ncbi:efflux RND transporter periplasmic adaptor subunit [Nisaea denitrificans]|uniref:efflux RND transporter periplasmic adaptor subunit n=1 Tax=Nisaea denitrificans TaxID=390877 RepID=UPI000A064ABD|nr:efflux RND transporter periplasmic adaptor subunit [Nisaea denitrificans]
MRRYRSFCLFGVLAGLLLVAGCEEQAAPVAETVRPVRAMKVSDVEAIARRSFPGKAKASKETDLAFKVAGPLVEFDLEIGQEVEKDQILGRIDPATYATEVQSATANLERAQARYEDAELEYKRQSTLFERGHVAKAKLDSVIASMKSLQADVAAAEAALRRSELDLNYTYLRAPFSGVIVKTHMENFENVRASQPAVRLLDSAMIEFVIDIPETLISLVPRVESAIVVFDAFPEHKIVAEIKEIGTEASETTRTYPVTLSMAQPEGIRILPGMAGTATGKVDGIRPAASPVQVPISATFTAGEDPQTMVWVIDEAAMTVTKRPVVTGALTDTGIQIVEGLAAGEWIATAGVHYLRDGQKVSILNQ